MNDVISVLRYLMEEMEIQQEKGMNRDKSEPTLTFLSMLKSN